jgi:8-oxo-dGTP diphosphatase
LAEPNQLRALSPNFQLGQLRVPTAAEAAAGEQVAVSSAKGLNLRLGFDHRDIVEHAIDQLRASIFHSDLGYAMLRPEFTLRELRLLHETILDKRLNKDNFRRKIIATGRLRETGTRQEPVGYRPAKLYRATG